MKPTLCKADNIGPGKTHETQKSVTGAPLNIKMLLLFWGYFNEVVQITGVCLSDAISAAESNLD